MQNLSQTLLLNSAHQIAIFSTDPNGNIDAFNTGAEQLLGYRAEDVINQLSPIVFYDPHDFNQWEQRFTHQSGKPVIGYDVIRAQALEEEPYQCSFLHKDNFPMRVQVKVSPIAAPTAGETGYLFMVTKILHRLRLVVIIWIQDRLPALIVKQKT